MRCSADEASWKVLKRAMETGGARIARAVQRFQTSKTDIWTSRCTLSGVCSVPNINLSNGGTNQRETASLASRRPLFRAHDNCFNRPLNACGLVVLWPCS